MNTWTAVEREERHPDGSGEAWTDATNGSDAFELQLRSDAERLCALLNRLEAAAKESEPVHHNTRDAGPTAYGSGRITRRNEEH